MPRLVRSLFFVILLTPLAMAYPGGRSESPGDNGIAVFVSVPPQAFFVERIAGDRARVSVLVPTGKSPHTYEPSPRQVVALSEADVFFSIGVDFERSFLPRIEAELPGLKIVDSAAGILRRDDEEHDTNEHGDPHVWLGIDEAEILARNTYEALAEIDPDYRAGYKKGLDELLAEIASLKTEIDGKLRSKRGEVLFVYHPSFGYFTDDFGLIQKAVETGGDEPTPKRLEAIIADARNENIAAMIIQPQFSRKAAELIATEIGVSVVSVDPLSADWPGTMRALADAATTE